MFFFAQKKYPRSVLAGFVVLLFALAVPAQRQKPLVYEELEKYGDPPAAFFQTGVSPGMHSTFGAFTSRQVNVNNLGQNITGDAANEPSITVDPTDHNKMVIGWRQFDSVSSNFREGGYGYTVDGGLTWVFPGVLSNNVFRSDPVLVATDTGQFFYNSLIESFFDQIWRSVNGGQTWVNLQPGGNARGGDKQWHTVDNTNSTGHGFQYQSWSTAGNNFGGRQFSRSTDGGSTWMDPVFIPNGPAWGTLDVDTNGNLFIGGVNLQSGQVWCNRSSDAKNAAVTPTFDQSVPVDLGGNISVQEPINPVGLLGQINLAVDRSGASTNNNIYMLSSVIPFGFFSGSDVMLARSTDGGQTFEAPVRINDDPPNKGEKWHWMAALSVAPNGRLDAVWLDTRNAVNNTDSQLFYSYSTDGGITWSQNLEVSIAFDPFLGYPNQAKMGDYMTIVSDNAGADVAYTATFNGEQDVYYVRVAPDAPSPSPTPTATPASPTITGTITYGNSIGAPSQRFISSVFISGAGSTPVTTFTNAAGSYALTGFGSGSYTVTPSLSGSQNGAITSFDAARIAQHATGLNPLSGSQLTVAEVSGNGTISSFDAGQVARFVVAVPASGSTGNWIFSPVNQTYPSVTSSIAGQDYVGLLMGEVSGNWLGAGARTFDAQKTSTTVRAPKISIPANKEFVVPVVIRGAAGKNIISYEFDLRYDPLVMRPLENPIGLTGTVSRGLMSVSNTTQPGLLRIVAYGPLPIDENGILLNLRFTAVGAIGSASPLTWERIMFNEGLPITATNGQVELR